MKKTKKMKHIKEDLMPYMKDVIDHILSDESPDTEIYATAVMLGEKMFGYEFVDEKTDETENFGRWIIKDWAYNEMFDGQEFDTFQDAEAFLSEQLGEAYDDDRQEYVIEDRDAIDVTKKNPPNWVANEQLWERAKEISKSSYGEIRWPFVTWLYLHQLGGEEVNPRFYDDYKTFWKKGKVNIIAKTVLDAENQGLISDKKALLREIKSFYKNL